MKKTSSLLILFLLLAFGVRLEGQVSETNSFPALNRAIPDGNASGLSDVRTLNSAIAKLSYLRLKVQIIGQFNGDLYCYLRHIQGGVTNFCVALNRPGRTASNSVGYADAGLNITFDDGASQGDVHLYGNVTNLPAGTALTGVWQPDGRRVDPDLVLDTSARTALLSAFTNLDGSGEWTLYLADLAAGGTNMLANWELDFIGIARPSLTWSAPADIVYGTALGPVQFNASTPVSGSFSYNPPSGVILYAGSNQVLTATFTPTDTNSYVPLTTNVMLNVLKKALTITAQNTNKLYGAPLPVFTAGFGGFITSETTNNLTSQPVLSTAAIAGSPAGNYPISVSGASGSNYTISYVPGTLVISKASTIGLLGSSANPALPGQSVGFSMSLSAVAPGAGTPAGSVQFRIDGAAADAPVALTASAATYSTTNLAHGTHTVSAEYAGDSNFLGTTNTLSPNQLIDTPPVAGPDTILYSGTNTTKVSIASLLANDSDADGDLINFVSVSASSAHGGTVVSNSGWIFYTPPVGFTNTDSFTYTISDGLAAPVTGVVTANFFVGNGPSPNLTITVSNSVYLISGSGIPGRTYRIQYSDTPNGAWQAFGTATADSFGVFQVTDPGGLPQRFYRSVYP